MKVAVLGCGNMGGAIIKGLLGKGIEVLIYDTSEEMMSRIDEKALRLPISDWFIDNDPDAIILAVKPQVMAEALKPFAAVRTTAIWVSIAAGVTIEKLESFLPQESKICRVMPNTPALINEGASAYSINNNADAEDKNIIESILDTLGTFTEVPEKLMNAVTAVSGSGPAYVYLFIEALIEAGVTAGLPRETAELLAVQTVKGSAAMVETTKENPSVLKSRVMSPGGTTAAALEELEKNGFKFNVLSAVRAAVKRAEELG